MGYTSKIAILCNYELLPERVGGMDHFFWEFDRKCKDNNIEVDWFFPNQARHGNYPPLNIIAADNTNTEAFFLNYLKESNTEYSYVFTHFAELCTPFFKEVKKLTKAKVIAVDHNPRPLKGYPLKKKIEKRIKGILFSKYIDKFIGVSQYTQNQILKDFGSHLAGKTAVIYNGVIINGIKVKETNNSFPKFMTASHLRFSKGIQDLIDAVTQLPPEVRQKLRIDLYGDGPYKGILIEKIRSQGVSGNFSFKGSRPDLNEIFCHYDFMIQPTHMECFSLAILESLAANVPVITTNVGGNEEVIMHGVNGFIFPASNVSKLKELLQQICNGLRPDSPGTRQEIENSFSIEQMVANHFQLMDDTL